MKKKIKKRLYYTYIKFLPNGDKVEKKLYIGKEIIILFFGPIPLIYRKQFLLALISLLTFFLANFYFYFHANDLRIKKYEKKGWIIIGDPFSNS